MNRPSDLPPLSEAELHGLVDSRLDKIRLAELRRRLKSHPAEQNRVDRWREQNDLIRATFAEVEGEILPVSLDLTPPPRLHCVVSDSRSVPLRQLDAPSVRGRAGLAKRTRLSLLVLTVLAIAAILAVLWVALDPRRASQPILAASSAVPADAVLAARTLDALNDAATGSSLRLPSSGLQFLATRLIPDLGDQGFGFIGATTRPDAPQTVIFLYQNGAAERVVLGLARAASSEVTASAVKDLGEHAVTWRRPGRRFVLAGTMPVERLRAIGNAISVKAITPDRDPTDGD